MTTLETPRSEALDPITLEVLRSRLEAIGEEAGAALSRTAISPIVTESKAYSCTLLDGQGRVVIGAGQIDFHFGAAGHAVQSTIELHGASIAPQDVFMANDPHNGGGLHPQDVMVQRPIFHGDRMVAWVVMSAHMMDMGGMVAGSFAPAATECYQEALRLPPVRLFRRGVEEDDVWSIIRTNIRLPELVEMDLRSLVAGCHVAEEKLADLVDSMGADRFVEGIGTIRDLTEAEMRRRIGELTPGTYRAESWAEWDDDFFRIPCRLTVETDRLVFDFEGASPQTSHFFNSKPYIIESEMVALLAGIMARDLPYNDGIFAPIELRCPEGTIVNARPPAPIAAAHMDVALSASEVGLECVRLALAASPDAPGRRLLTGWGTGSGLGLHSWTGTGLDGNPDAFIMADGNWVGSSAGLERDGLALSGNIVGRESDYSFTDVEVLESWYPILISEKRSRPSEHGAGEHRAGGGNLMTFRPHGTDKLTGVMLGMRRWMPLPGHGGGTPGPTTEFVIHRSDGTSEDVATHASDIELSPDDLFEFRCASGGGFGDPLDREPAAVQRDVHRGVIDTEIAQRVYGVALDDGGQVDPAATADCRQQIARERLERAQPPAKPVSATLVSASEPANGADLPLYLGVVQRGNVAMSERSGAPLAVAPDHWTDGCPVLVEPRSDLGPEVDIRSYLDPATGYVLFVEAAPAGAPRSFESAPSRWTEAG
ncbi:MAG: hydantoinase B/oxoprolinase family protein [Actinobacteria bacterium]|nr:MAG: hydantoinase B/oxoprolinase family protein [Actinomycetota bacterium]